MSTAHPHATGTAPLGSGFALDETFAEAVGPPRAAAIGQPDDGLRSVRSQDDGLLRRLVSCESPSAGPGTAQEGRGLRLGGAVAVSSRPS